MRASYPEASIITRLTGLIKTADPGEDRPLDVDDHPRNAQAALDHGLGFLRKPLDLRIDQGLRCGVGVGLEDQQAAQPADLVGSETDPEAVLHQMDHALDLFGQCVVELGHVRSTTLEHRVAVLDHLGQSLGPAATGLFVEAVRAGCLLGLSSGRGIALIFEGERLSSSFGFVLFVHRERV